MDDKEKTILKTINKLGVATELEVQAAALLQTDKLKAALDKLESDGYIKREFGFLSSINKGDGLKITEKGVKSL